MSALEHYLAMGGYAAFVWPAYGLVTVVMVGLLVLRLRTLRRTEAALAAMRAAHPGGRRDIDGEALR